MELLRKKDLHPEIGVAKSTIADWIEDFNIYIPRVQQENVTYYRPETLDVLRFIKQCREQNYQKQQIMEALSANNFPVTVEEAKEDAEKAINKYVNPNGEDFFSIFRTMGQAVQKLSNQDESITSLQNKENEHDGRIENVEKRTERTDEMVESLKQEIQHLKKELATTKEKTKSGKKGFFRKLFGESSRR